MRKSVCVCVCVGERERELESAMHKEYACIKCHHYGSQIIRESQ